LYTSLAIFDYISHTMLSTGFKSGESAGHS